MGFENPDEIGLVFSNEIDRREEFEKLDINLKYFCEINLKGNLIDFNLFNLITKNSVLKYSDLEYDKESFEKFKNKPLNANRAVFSIFAIINGKKLRIATSIYIYNLKISFGLI
ncbi:MAG: hypothetical protein AABY22_22665 [Nanoarchaeota archaeon]